MSEHWRDLQPEPSMVAALDAADRLISRSQALSAGGSDRNRWSNGFADGCARMIAPALARRPELSGLTILPGSGGRAEPPVFVAGGKRKKVDVTASSLVSGLQVGISLKGLNFRDATGLNFDKNLTGRTYELQDEIRVIHDHLPSAFMVAVYFVPVAATEDKRGRGPSSFATIVAGLRARTGRIDRTLPSQAEKADLSFVALYVPGDVESFEYSDRAGEPHRFTYTDRLTRGVVRFFDVHTAPPRRGRPRVETTLGLAEMTETIARSYLGEISTIEYAEPEPD